jgi:divalent metal cation (Fe/Co/Zn/Cd) transporter
MIGDYALLDGSSDRARLVRRGLRLNYVTIGYNVVEATVALLAGLASGSVALVGFGVDSVIEVAASGTAQWRLRADVDPTRREAAERRARTLVGWSFVALALYVSYESGRSLWLREPPSRSVAGTGILAVSAIVMPILARAKGRIARALRSGALESEATQTSLCAYLSIIALAGVGLNAAAGWWWADPVTALGMVPIIVLEALDGIRGRTACEDCR